MVTLARLLAFPLSANRTPAARLELAREPCEEGHIDAGAVEFYSFGFEESALERAVRFGDEESSAGANDAMPRDALSAGTSGHSVADGTCSSGEAQGTRQFAIRRDATTRNLFDEPIDRLPGHVLVCSR
jgi:hypothetical protein